MAHSGEMSEGGKGEDDSSEGEEAYEAGGGKMSYHGMTYQLRLLMYFLLRGLANSYSFALATDIKDADKFDDVVFRCRSEDGYVYRLLQAKHRAGKQTTSKITLSALLSEGEKGDFSLKKYFRSFLKLLPNFSGEGKTIRDVIICTNGGFKMNEPFGSGRFGDIFEYRKDENGGEVMDEIFRTKLLCLKKEFEGRRKFVELLKGAVTGKEMEKKVESFLDLLSFAIEQPNCDSLKEGMLKEFREEYKVSDPKMVFALFQHKIYEWMTKFEGFYFTVRKGEKFMEYVRNRFGSFRFGFDDPVGNFQGRRKELNDIWKARERGEKTVIVSGLGGIGKSELARKFLQENLERFRRIVWMNADSPQSLVRSFRRLALERLNISNVGTDGQEKEMDSILEEVYKFFDGDDCIFVFDNVEKTSQDFEEGDYVKNFLPTSSKNPFLVMTTRFEFWDDAFVLPIGEILEEDAVEFIKSSLHTETQDCLAKRLALKLQNFPLALQQAVAYINYEDSMIRFGIEDYLELYENESKDLLNFKFSNFRKDTYAKTTFTTWSITLKIIQKNIHGDTAYSILKLISYFSPVNIHRAEIANYFKELGENELKKSLRLLKEYSIISFAKGLISIHRLVQQVVRLTLKDAGEDENVLKWALESSHDISIEHVIQMWEIAQNYKKLATECSHLPKRIMDSLKALLRYEEGYIFGKKWWAIVKAADQQHDDQMLDVMKSFARVAADHGKYQHSLDLHKEIYNRKKSAHGDDDEGVMDAKYEIAGMYIKIAEYDQALVIYEELLERRRKSTLSETHLSVLDIKYHIAYVLNDLGKYEMALSTFEEVYQEREHILGANHPSTLSSRNKIGKVLYNLSQYDRALPIFEEVFEKRRVLLGENHPKTCTTLRNIADTVDSLGDYKKALSLYEQIYEREKQTLGEDHPTALVTKNNIAYALERLCKHDEALNIYQEVYEKEKQAFGEDHPEALVTRRNIADTLESLGRYKDSLAIYESVLEKEKVVFGDDHPNALATMINMGIVLVRLGQYKKALKTYEEVYEKERVTLGEDNPSILTTMNNIGFALDHLGEFRKAFSFYEKVYKNRASVLGENHPSTLNAGSSLALNLHNLGQYGKSLSLSQDVYERLINTVGEYNYTALAAGLNIARALTSLCKFKEALQIRKEIQMKYKEQFGDDHTNTLNVRSDIAESLQHLGKYREALHLYEEVFEKQKLVIGVDHRLSLKTMKGMATAHRNLGNYEKALSLYKEVNEKENKCLGTHHKTTLETKADIAGEISRLGDSEKAIMLYEEAYEIEKQVLGDDHPTTLSTRCKIGDCLVTLGKYEEALQVYEDVHRNQRDCLGDNHLSTLITNIGIVTAIQNLGKPEDAHSLCEETYQKCGALLGLDHPITLTLKCKLASVLLSLCLYDKSLAFYEEVYEEFCAVLGVSHPYTLTAKCGIASVLCHLGEYCRSLSVYQNVYDQEKELLGANHPYTLNTKHHIAHVLVKLYEYEEALVVFGKVYEKRKSILGEGHPDTLQTKECMTSLTNEHHRSKGCILS